MKSEKKDINKLKKRKELTERKNEDRENDKSKEVKE